jgi:hypothetical protein
MLTLIFTFILSFFDPFVFVPSILIGWFVKKREDVLIYSGVAAVLMAVIFYQIRQNLGDAEIAILPLMVRIAVAIIIAKLVYGFKKRKDQKSGDESTTTLK